MPEHVSILQLMGVAVLALATVIWVVGLSRLLRRARTEVAVRPHGQLLRAMPRQRRSGPAAESVELTPEEHAAFAGLVRQFSDSRP
ncbi:hypothetical protein HEP84_22980 [Streptomyces sp. RLB1-33]|uniref:hypothetical protein n=1 Tax=Streptomyces mirabilis TaxID=68239 RepID=UPI00143E711F|nr:MULTISPECIES: hypothetical protein [Streptomyces]QIY71609.1 hypothetical protein HEP84_22980 [Streptomyces sp. RLB1-33]QUW81417.1 hypothetical protein SMIR_21845 [Streptomyces mirabilis]